VCFRLRQHKGKVKVMRKGGWKSTLMMFFLAWPITLTSGCGAMAPQPEAAPVSTPPEEKVTIVAPEEGPNHEEHEAPPPLAPEEGLSYEEHRSTFPPPPENLQASRVQEGVLLTWTPPAPVEIPHTYSDDVSHYRVFRRSGEELESTLLGTTEETRYLDQDVHPGVTYHYLVTAVFEDGWEGDRPNEVSITIQQ